MIFLLGLLDIVSAFVLIVLYYKVITIFAIIPAVYLMAKILFFRDFVSLIDFFAGLVVILAIFGVKSIFLWIFALWLLQKGVFSLFR